MNTEKRQNAYLQVKNYIKHRKKKLRFPFHPSVDRCKHLRDDLKFLKQVNYETLQCHQSEVWAQCRDIEEPLHVSTVPVDSFWEFLYSQEWDLCSSLRVCEGALLSRLVEELYWLHHQGSLATYRMERFDFCHFPAPRPAFKSSDVEVTFKSEPVKIGFNVYFRPKARRTSASTRSSSSRPLTSLSVSKYTPTIYTGSVCTRSADAAIASSESPTSKMEAPPSPVFQTISPSEMNNCINLASPIDNELENVLGDSECMSGMSHTDNLQEIDSPYSLLCYSPPEKTPSAASMATSATKSSIQFQPSHESMESTEVVFYDLRHGGDSEWETEGNRSYLSQFDEAEEEWNEGDRIMNSQLKHGFRGGLSWRRGAPVAVNVSGNAHSESKTKGSMTSLRNQPSRGQLETRDGAIPPSPSFTPTLLKVHPDRAALAQGSRTGPRVIYFNTKGKVISTNGDLRSEEEASLKFSAERIGSGPTVNEHMGKSESDTVLEKEGKKSIGSVKSGNTVRFKAGDIHQDPAFKEIDTRRLNRSYSIDKLKLLSRGSTQENNGQFSTLSVYKRNHVESTLCEQLGAIYQKRGILHPQKNHRIHLLVDDPRMKEKAKRIANYKKPAVRVSPRSLFPDQSDRNFRLTLIQAAQDFVIRKELVTCKGRPPIISVTFNRIAESPLGG